MRLNQAKPSFPRASPIGVGLLVLSIAVLSLFAQQPARSKIELDKLATTELEIATGLYAKGDAASIKVAIDKLTNALTLASESGNSTIRASALLLRGLCNFTIDNPSVGVIDVEKSLELYTSINDRTGQFLGAGFLSAHYLKQKDIARARPYMVRSWEQLSASSLEKLDKSVIANAGPPLLTLLGDTFITLGDRKRGLDFLWWAYELTADGSESDRIRALLKYGQAQIALDTPKLATSFFETALKRARNAKLRTEEAESLLALGELHVTNFADGVSARKFLAEALAIAEELNNNPIRFRALVRLGDAVATTLDLPQALVHYNKANELGRHTEIPPADRALVLYKLSDVQFLLGETKQGAENEEAALALATTANYNSLRAKIISTRALRAMELGLADTTLTGDRSKEAARRIVEQLTTAIALVKDTPAGRILAIEWLSQIGSLLSRMGQYQAALDILNKTLESARAGSDRSVEAMLLSDRGMTRYMSGDYAGAVNDINQSLAIYRSIGFKGREARSMEYLMYVWSRYNNRSLAIFFGKSAINLYQEIRRDASVLSLEQQNALLGKFAAAYRKLANLLVEEGRLAEAESVLTMLKQEELIEYVRRDDAVAKQLLESVAVSDDERAAITRYAVLAEKITSIGKEFNDLETERKQYAVAEFPQQKRYDELKQQLADATTVFEKFLEELKTKFGQSDKRVAQVDSSLRTTLERLKAHRTAVVSTIVGDDSLSIIVTTSRTQRAHTIRKGAKEINELVAKLRQTLTTPQYDPRPASQELYDLLVKPIEADLAGIRADTIVWSLDGTLRYLPPAALWDKQKGYLVERFSNVVINLGSRDTIALPVEKGQELSVLGVGVSKAGDGFAPLAAVPDELDCIVSDKSVGPVASKPQCPTGVLSGRKLLDEKFTLANFQGELGRYPIVHIASHFKLTPGDDSKSFLLLGGGDDRRYTVDKLRTQSLTDVELIVFSACNTATPGGTKANGIEIEGFASIAQRGGAKAVMATLWPVADDSTKDFMVDFYRRYGRDGKTKADATRFAQMQLLNGSYPAAVGEKQRGDKLVIGSSGTQQPFTLDPKAPYAHPYFWSPFILIGNWR